MEVLLRSFGVGVHPPVYDRMHNDSLHASSIFQDGDFDECINPHLLVLLCAQMLHTFFRGHGSSYSNKLHFTNIKKSVTSTLTFLSLDLTYMYGIRVYGICHLCSWFCVILGDIGEEDRVTQKYSFRLSAIQIFTKSNTSLAPHWWIRYYRKH